MKRTDRQLRRRDARRDIGAEVLQAVRDIKAGKGKRITLPVPTAVEARHKVGVSQAEFARLLGVSVRTLQDWEQGRRQPTGAARSLLAVASKRPKVMREVLRELAEVPGSIASR
jgi:putative transcriptional regulator